MPECSERCGYDSEFDFQIERLSRCLTEGHGIADPPDGGEPGQTLEIQEHIERVETTCPYLNVEETSGYPITTDFLNYIEERCLFVPTYLYSGLFKGKSKLSVTYSDLEGGAVGTATIGDFTWQMAIDTDYLHLVADLDATINNNAYLHETGHFIDYSTFGPFSDSDHNPQLAPGPLKDEYLPIVLSEGPVTAYPATYSDVVVRVRESFADAFWQFYHPGNPFGDILESNFPRTKNFLQTRVDDVYRALSSTSSSQSSPSNANADALGINTDETVITDSYEGLSLEDPGNNSISIITKPNGLYSVRVNEQSEELEVFSTDDRKGTYKFYRDQNDNSKFDKNIDTKLFYHEEVLNLQKVADLIPYKLDIGWNSITIPLGETERSVTSASELLALIKEQGGSLLMLPATRIIDGRSIPKEREWHIQVISTFHLERGTLSKHIMSPS